MKRRRLWYALLTALLFAVEVCIALFAHDAFVRPFLGDVLVVILVHCAVRVAFPLRPRLLPLYVFAFACGVEALQGIHILDLLGLSQSAFLTVVVGTSFSWLDILCYLVGCIFCACGEGFTRKKSR
ncbi:MAG: DUF2809 domain-containing protein [Oscillospiraceae bacterium]|jgi:hypothetical protein|nr:DUF2809 domain-containing protein [Oscillospiraceae bacterium]